MYQRVGKQAFKKNLDNILAFTDYLDKPQNKFLSVHIAGTNGKGSVTHLMASALVAQGFRVGIYTSPHYFDFKERIKIGRDFISEKQVLAFVNEHYDKILEVKPSFFEITVAMAFNHFAQQKVDIAIIETGLGGRLDSTNIIKPLLSVITNISYDHQAMLGNTLQKIATEKAGIIKPNTPIVIGEYQREVADLFKKKALHSKATISFANRKRVASVIRNLSKSTPAYMIKNRVTAYVALNKLKSVFPNLKINQRSILEAFDLVHENVYYIGRWQQLSDRPKIYLDSAHNEAGLKQLLLHLKSVNYKTLHIVLGFVEDKNHSSILKLLPKYANYHFAKANIPRGLDALVLLNKAKAFNLVGEVYTSVDDAFRGAKERANSNDLILVMGSIFLIAEIHEANST